MGSGRDGGAVSFDGAGDDVEVATRDSGTDATTLDAAVDATSDGDATTLDAAVDAMSDGAVGEASSVSSDARPVADAASDATTSGGPTMCATTCPPGTFGGQGECMAAAIDTSCTAARCAAPNATTGCDAHGKCIVVSCLAGWADCDGNAANGCETDVTSPNDCNTCGNACTGVAYICASSGCVSTCPAGTTYEDPGRCIGPGAWSVYCADGDRCSDENAARLGTTACGTTAGTCGAFTCYPGLTQCAPNTKCVDTTSDDANCGACGNACTSSAPAGGMAHCSDSTCVPGCPPDTLQCGAACVFSQVDPANCGGCGHACAAGQVCLQPGVCADGSSLWIASGLGSAITALAVDDTSVFWIDPVAFAVNAMPKAGGAVTVLASSQYDIASTFTEAHLAVDDTYVYWMAHGLLRTRKDGTGAVELLNTTPLTFNGPGLAVVNGAVYVNASATVDAGPSSGLLSVPVGGGVPSWVAWIPTNGAADLATDGTSIFAVSVVPLPPVSGNESLSVLSYDFSGTVFGPAGVPDTLTPAASAWVRLAQARPGNMCVDLVPNLAGEPSEPGVAFSTAADGVTYSGVLHAAALGPCDGVSIAAAGLGVVWSRASGTQGTLVDLVPASIALPTSLTYDGTYLYWTDALESTGRIGRVPVK